MAQSKAGLLILFLVRGDSFVRTRTSRRCSELLPGPSADQRHDIAGSVTCAEWVDKMESIRGGGTGIQLTLDYADVGITRSDYSHKQIISESFSRSSSL